MTVTLIETKTLGSAAASIEFTEIPQTFTDLVVKLSVRSSTTATGNNLRFNGDSGNNYDSRRLYGNGSNAYSVSYLTQPAIYVWDQTLNTYTANTFSNIEIYIPNYTGATHKSVSIDGVSENNATEAHQSITAGIWKNTSAITAVFLLDGGGNYVVGSSFSLYGILKGSDGIVTTS